VGQEATVVQLGSRANYRPDLDQLARSQLATARSLKGMSRGEFAGLLSTMTGWPVSEESIKAWETNATPPGAVVVAAELIVRQAGTGVGEGQPRDALSEIVGNQFADVTGVYPSRSEFQAKVSVADLFDDAREIRACGLSLNMLCQTYADTRLLEIIEGGATLRCLFLEPYGRFIKQREQEEGYPEGQLSALTALNLSIMKRVADRLSAEAAPRLRYAVYDEPLHFNIFLIDGQLCVAQPYLPQTRGVDSPTFLVRKRPSTGGLFRTFEQVFNALWERNGEGT
jgi:hypothetical protein